MSLILRSNSIYTGPDLVPGYSQYIDRVRDDGGEIVSLTSLYEALSFCAKNGIGHDQGFSLTSAAWGIKRSLGNITKFYNLFGADGDVTPIGGSISYQLKNDIPTSYWDGNRLNHMSSTGSTTDDEVAVIFAASADFLTNPSNVLGGYQSVGDLTPDGRVLVVGAASTPTTVSLASYSRGNTLTSGVPLSQLQGFGSHMDDNGITRLITAGEVVNTQASADVLGREKQLHLGRLSYSSNNNFKGNIAETWAMANVTKDQVLAVSKRIEAKYGGNL